jgi:pimeloyl-ACP methyl ester carboxylesterase
MVYSLLRWAGEEALFAEAVGVVEAFFVLSTPATEAAWRQGTDRYHGAGARAGLPETARAALLARPPIVIERCHALLSNPTSPDDCRRLGVRTLVLCGDRTGAPERRLSEIVAGLMRDCSFRLIAGAGHMSPLTHPVEVAAAIRAHLTRVAHGALAAPHDLLQRTEVRDAHRGR